MEVSLKQNRRHLLFNLAIILKGIDGLLEFVGGLFFVFLKKQGVLDSISKVLHYNLFKISNESVLDFVDYMSQMLSTSTFIFISAILIGNGVVKMLVSVGLLLRKFLAFIVAIVFLMLLLVYQIVECFYTPSLVLDMFTLFEALVIYVIWREYRYLKRTRGFR
ncbi:MAG: DUF2127 domain-containing protein [Chlamydiales bacterium]|nr:DUF2127 domain-containing protein [Chlamydiales bacterium]